MGIANVNCCSKQNPIITTECKVPEDIAKTSSNVDKQLSVSPLIKKLTLCKTISSLLDFLLSGDYYLLLISQKTSCVLIPHLTKILNHNDILALLVKMIDWIQMCNSKNNVTIQKTKQVIKLVTKNLIRDIEKGNGNKNVKVNISYGLFEVSQIVQYIKYSTEKGSTKYKVNYWGGQNIDECLRLNLYNVIAYLVKAKEMGTRKRSMKNVHESTLENFNMNKQTEETAKVVGNFLEEIMSKVIK